MRKCIKYVYKTIRGRRIRHCAKYKAAGGLGEISIGRGETSGPPPRKKCIKYVTRNGRRFCVKYKRVKSSRCVKFTYKTIGGKRIRHCAKYSRS